MMSLPERIAEWKRLLKEHEDHPDDMYRFNDAWNAGGELAELLVPAYEAILSAMESLRKENERLEGELKTAREDHTDFLGFMRDDLAHLPCCHEDGGHHGTPPMMWPELIRCIILKDRRTQLAGIENDV